MTTYIETHYNAKAQEYFRLYIRLREAGLDREQIEFSFDSADSALWALIEAPIEALINGYEFTIDLRDDNANN